MAVTTHIASAEDRTTPARTVVGPNAIIQLAAALSRCEGAVEQRVFSAAGLEHYLEAPPSALVSEHEAARLFAATRSLLGAAEAETVLATAGSLTADYITINRIPRRARQMLRLTPRWLATRAMLVAIKAHAWTFAGSGSVTIDVGRHPSMTIADNPLATPGSPWHVAVLQGLFRNTVAPAALVTHSRRGTADCFHIQT